MNKSLHYLFGTLLLIVSFAGYVTNNISKTKTSLWEVTSPQRIIYIASDPGVLSAKDYPLPKPFKQAFSASAVLYVEHIPTPEKKVQEKIRSIIMEHGVLPTDESLKDFLTPNQLQAVKAMAKDAGFPFSQVKRTPPWRLAMAFGGGSPDQASNSGIKPKEQLTYQLFLKAKSRNLRIIPLESYTELFKIVYSLPIKVQVGWLMMTIDSSDVTNGKKKSLIRNLDKAWRHGNSMKVMKYSGGDYQKLPKLNEALVINRNRTWVSALEKKLHSKGKPIFVVVGDGHLMGPQNMLDLLRADGYQVHQL